MGEGAMAVPTTWRVLGAGRWAGSVPLFVSMAAHAALTMLVRCVKCPDWKEECKLWKLMQRQRTHRGGRRLDNDDNKWGL
mmetsp:Transcript_28900/g.69647  ORF Transcript_28900/g.69647 Transcript_28900/m.69647 type:complete len:80 (+) Transcript_28900:236-475(+)